MVTIVEIAQACGLSKSTVSAVLNDPTGKSHAGAETRKKILEAARKMGYSPNQAARSLRHTGSQLVAVLDRVRFSSYGPEILRGISDMLQRSNYQLLYCPYDSPEELARQIRGVDAHRPLIWITVGYVTPPSREQLQKLLDRGEKLVQVCSQEVMPGASGVHVDPQSLGRAAAEYLLDHGHRSIFYGASWQGPLCWEGFSGVFAERGLDVENCCYVGNFIGGEASGRQMLHTWMDRGRRESAIFAFDDVTAGSILSEAYRCHVRIPEELSVIGVDDREFGAFLAPPLTTLHQPQYERGILAGEIAVRQIRKKDSAPEIRLLQPHVVERQSVKDLGMMREER